MKQKAINCVYTTNFVGPLGLLLELIEKRGLDVSRIALVEVADQYWECVKKDRIGMSEAADFLEIASQLVFIKSRFLILGKDGWEEEEEENDLEERVRIYAKFRQAAGKLEKFYGKNLLAQRRVRKEDWQGRILGGKEKINKNELKWHLEDVLKRLPELCILKEKKVKIGMKMADIMGMVKERLRKASEVTFFGIAGKMNKAEMALAFLAVLELARKKEMRLFQKEFLGDIAIFSSRKL